MKNLIRNFILLLSMTTIIACTSSKEVVQEQTVVPEARTTQSVPPSDKQRGQRGGDREAQQAAMMAKLNLSTEQETMFNSITGKYRQQMRDTRENYDGNIDGMREKMRSLREAQNTEIQGILTSEQNAVYQKMMAERKQRGGGKRGGGRQGG